MRLVCRHKYGRHEIKLANVTRCWLQEFPTTGVFVSPARVTPRGTGARHLRASRSGAMWDL